MTYPYDIQDIHFVEWLDDNNHLVTERTLEEQYDEMLDECYPEITIGYGTYYPSDILKNLDPISYEVGKNEHIAAMKEVKEDYYVDTEELESLWEEYLQELIDDAADDAVHYITRKLNEIAFYYLNDGIESIDVRLNVWYKDGELSYNVLFGDSQYDTDHRGAWSYDFIHEDIPIEELAQELWDTIELY